MASPSMTFVGAPLAGTVCSLKVRFVTPQAAALYAGHGGLEHASAAAAGLDLRACLPRGQESVLVQPGERALIPCGIAVEPCLEGGPASLGVAGFVYSRSGLGARDGLTVAQGVGVIDADYRGEVLVMLLNTCVQPRTLAHGERVAQLVMQPVWRVVPQVVETLGQTGRGAGGFGHTGKI